jgi:hypothetical protein
LFTAFKSSKTGADLMNKATGALSGIMSVLVGIADGLATALVSLFEDPMGSLKDFGKAIGDNILNRFKAVAKSAGILGKVVGKLLTGDFNGAKEAAKEAGDAMIQFGTGLDPKQQKEFAAGVKEVVTAVYEQTAAFVALEDAKRAMAITNLNLGKTIEKLTAEEQRLNQIYGDGTLAVDVREAAAKKAGVATVNRAKKEIELAQNSLSLLDRDIKLRDENNQDITALYGQQVAATRAVIAAESALVLAQMTNATDIRQIKTDAAQIDLDLLIDGLDNQKSINERLLSGDKLNYEQKVALLKETEKLNTDSFKQQVAVIQNFTDKRIDANALVAESDDKVNAETIKSLGLSEEMVTRMLEIVKERKTALQDIAESGTDVLVFQQQEINEKIESKYDDLITIEKVKLEERLTSKGEFDLKINLLESENLKNELEQLELSEEEKRKKQNELDLLEAQRKSLTFGKSLTDLETTYDREKLLATQNLNKKFEDEALSETQREIRVEAHEEKLYNLESAYLQKKGLLYQEKGIENINLQQEIAQRKVENNNNKNAELLESDKLTAEQRQVILNGSLDVLGTFVSGTKALLENDMENRDKYAGLLKALAIAEIAINLSKELSAIAAASAANPLNALTFGATGITQYTVQSVIAIARSGFAVANVLGAFADGGYTGESNVGIDSTGQRPVGVVHENEFVANRFALKDPISREMISIIDDRQTKLKNGQTLFAGGGFTSPQVSPMLNIPQMLEDSQTENLQTAILKELQLTRANIKNQRVINDPSETVAAAAKRNEFVRTLSL